MGQYAYKALDAAGKVVRGSIDADTEQAVISRLRDRQLHVIDVSEKRNRKAALSLGGPPKRCKLQSLVVFTRQFATMLDAGIGMVRCLDILEGQSKDPALKLALGGVKRDVRGGSNLTEAMARHPGVFNRLYVNMVRAAEAGGEISDILSRIASFLEKEQEVRTKIKGALIYPIMVLIFSFLMMMVLFLFVLPKFKEIFLAMNVEMPAATKFLFGASDFARQYWYFIFGAMAAAFAVYKMFAKTEKGRLRIDGFKLRMPVVGEIVTKMAISKLTRTLGTLVSSGVPMLRSMEIVSETTGNVVITGAVDGARTAIKEGQKISAPLARSGLIPAMVTQMIDVGEETGRLSEMLTKVADFYDQEVDAAVKGLTSLIEPMLIVVMGLLVGFIAISVMSPIFKLVSSLS
jgi:type IV pilus assembly protein PilC